MRPALLLHVGSVEARKLMSYRADFWVSTVAAFFVELAVAYFLWAAIFAESGAAELGGFSLEGMILYYVLAILLGKLVRGGERQLAMATDIYEGSLTRYLLYPSPYFGMKYAEHLGGLVPALVQGALFGGAAVAVFDFRALGAVTPGTVARAAATVAVANLLYFLLAYAVEGVAFWADNVWTLSVMLRFVTSMLGGLLLPLSLFPEAAQRALGFLPFPYLFYVPVMTLLGRLGPAEWLRATAVALAWCGVLALVCRALWRRGYRTYTGVGI